MSLIFQQLTADEAKILKYIANRHEGFANIWVDEAGEGEAIEEIRLQFKHWCEQASVTCIKKSNAYMDNLVRLRIFNQVMGRDAPYDYHEDYRWSEYMGLELTSFGRLFLDACIEKIEPNK